jgi:hypothetical protein
MICRELSGFGDVAIIVVGDLTVPRGWSSSPIFLEGVTPGSFRYQMILFSFGRITDS